MPASSTSSNDGHASPPDAVAPIKKPAFIADVATRSGLKKRDAKAAIDAALAVLAAALAKGDELVLPPLGKLRVIKAREIGSGASVLTLKLRTTKDGAGTGKSGLAVPDNDD